MGRRIHQHRAVAVEWEVSGQDEASRSLIAQQKQELQNMHLPRCLKVVGLSTAPAHKATAIKADYLNIRSDLPGIQGRKESPKLHTPSPS